MDLHEKVSHLPSKPGVYIMKGSRGSILYIGKAKTLSDRIRSYFQPGAQHTPRIQHLVSQVKDFECLVTATELEALILENNLIKKHRPKYNVVLRDDKNYPYLRLPLQDDFPRLEIVRRVKSDGALYFGPYVPTHALRDTLRLLRRLFPLPNCNIVIDGTADRACIEFEIKRCLAPCTGHQSREDYREMMRQVRLFLEGKDNELLKILKSRMEVEAARLNFEEAARLRDQVANIERTLERQRITTTDSADLDVVAAVRGGEAIDFQVLFIRGGMMVGRKDFFMTGPGDASEEELYGTFIQQFYDKEGLVPPAVVTAVAPADSGLLERWLSEKRGASVRLGAPQRGKAAHLIGMARDNARVSLEEHLRIRRAGTAASQELQRILNLRHLPRRIEAFDISNIMGDQAVGSRVVWEDNAPKKSAYRKFKIRTIRGANDFGMMREVLIRWYSRARDHEEPLPDLIVIDGGKGQLSAAIEAMRIVGLTGCDLAGLAKEKGEKFERVFLPEFSTAIPLDPASPATHLLQRVRDEAHRFAITYHRKLRGRELVLSVLDEVEGIGESRKKALLKKFGSLDGIRRSSVEDLQTVPGISRKRAEAVIDRLNQTDLTEGGMAQPYDSFDARRVK
jgi:excinuclease ABC subunit C